MAGPAQGFSGDRLTALNDRRSGYSKPLVGLAGGIGSGKSCVAKILSELGAGIIDSDKLSHQEINEPDVRELLVRWWGPQVVGPDGTVDRKQIGAIVFADPSQRNKLEALIHPRIAVRRQCLMDAFESQPRVRMIVLDSPLLYETDLDLSCDAVIFVDAPLKDRIARAAKNRRWPAGELERREKLHQPLDMKRARADYICDNSSSLSDLRMQIERIFNQIVSESGAIQS